MFTAKSPCHWNKFSSYLEPKPILFSTCFLLRITCKAEHTHFFLGGGGGTRSGNKNENRTTENHLSKTNFCRINKKDTVTEIIKILPQESRECHFWEPTISQFPGRYAPGSTRVEHLWHSVVTHRLLSKFSRLLHILQTTLQWV